MEQRLSIFDFLDTLSDEKLLKFLNLRFGQDEPIWKECTKEEFEKHSPNHSKAIEDFIKGKSTALPLLEDFENLMRSSYKKVPVYKDWKGGLISLMELQQEKEPDYYNYYKKVGTKRVIMVGSQIMDYLKKRGIEV